MRAALKATALLLGLAAAAIVAAMVAIPLYFDPNDFKDRIADAVKDSTGRELRIEGDIRLTYFPWLGAELGAVAFGNPPSFPGGVFARTERMRVRVKLLPLLARQVEMGTVTLEGLRLHFSRNEEGRTNWEDLLKRSKKERKALPVSLLAVGGLRLQGATITWDDAVTGKAYRVSRLDVETGPLSLGEPIAVDVAFDVETAEPALAGSIKAQAEVAANLDAQRYRATDLTLSVQVSGASLPGGALSAKITGDGLYEPTRQMLAVSRLAMEVPDLAVADASVKLRLQGEARTDLAKGSYAFQNARLTSEVSGPAVPGKTLGVAMDANLRGELDKQTLTISSLTLRAAELEARGEIEVAALLDEPRYSGNLELAPFNPRKVLARIGDKDIETADANALTSATLQAGISGSGVRVSLEPLRAQLDDTRLEGSLTIRDFAAPALSFDLLADTLDADRYLPPAAEDQGTVTPGAVAAALPMESLRALNVNGALRVTRLNLAKLKVEDAEIHLDANNGLVKVSPVRARLYEGAYEGSVAVDARSSTPEIALNERLSKVRLGSLLKDLQGGAVAPALADAAGDIALRGSVTTEAGGQQITAKGLHLSTDLRGKKLPGGRLTGSLGGDAILDRTKDALSIQDLTLNAYGVKGTGKIEVREASTDARRLSGNLKLARFDLRRALGQAGLPEPRTSQPEVFSQTQLSTRFDASAERVALEQMELKVDASTLKGKLELAALRAKAPRARFDLDLDGIDLDAYLPPPSTTTKAGGVLIPVPVDVLRTLDVQGDLDVSHLKLNDLRAQNVKVTVKGKNGKIVLNPLSAGLYSGFYTGLIGLTAEGDQPEISTDSQIIEVALGPLLQDLQGRAPVTGLASARLSARSRGATKNALLSTLDGTLEYEVTQGTVEKIDMAEAICLSAAGGTRTPFTELRGKLSFAQGRASNDDLYMLSNVVELQEQTGGGGYVDLINERLNLLLMARLGAPCAGTAQALGVLGAIVGRKVRELRQLQNLDCLARTTLGFPVTGTISEPNYSGLRAAAQQAWNRCSQQKAQAPAEQPSQTTQPEPRQPAGSLFEEILRRQLEGSGR